MTAVQFAGPGYPQRVPDKAERPEIKVGDQWKFEVRDKRTGTAIREDLQTVIAVSRSQIDATLNGEKNILRPDLVEP